MAMKVPCNFIFPGNAKMMDKWKISFVNDIGNGKNFKIVERITWITWKNRSFYKCWRLHGSLKEKPSQRPQKMPRIKGNKWETTYSHKNVTAALKFCSKHLWHKLGNKLDKMYKIKYLFKQKLFGINPPLVIQYVQ